MNITKLDVSRNVFAVTAALALLYYQGHPVLEHPFLYILTTAFLSVTIDVVTSKLGKLIAVWRGKDGSKVD